MADLKTMLFTDIVGSVDLKSEMPGRSDTERDQAFIDRVLTPHRERIERELAGIEGVSFHNHGRRELKGIGRVEIYELLYDEQGPRQMRPQPRESFSRQWTVLPATMGLSEFRDGSGRKSANPQAGFPRAAGGR